MTSLVSFTLDLTAHEDARLTAVLDALRPHCNPPHHLHRRSPNAPPAVRPP